MKGRIWTVFSGFLLLLAGCEVSSRKPPIPQIPNPLIHLDFNGTTEDRSGLNRKIVANGGTFVAARSPEAGTAFQFDGRDDFLRLGRIPELLRMDSLTISAWILMDFEINPRWFFSNCFVENAFAGIMANVVYDGRPQVLVGNGAHIGRDARYTLRSHDAAISKMQWTHVTWVVVNPTAMKMYINGKPVAGYYSGNSKNLVYTDSCEATIGIGDFSTYPDEGIHYFRGVVDDFKVFGAVLSEEQVAANARF